MTTGPTHTHPVAAAIDQAAEAIASTAASVLWSLADDQLTDDLTGVHRLKSQVAALELRLVREADSRDLSARANATSTAAWLTAATRSSRREAGAAVRLAEALERHARQTQAALAAGRVSQAQAEAIARMVADLPGDIDPGAKSRAEAWLIEQADEFGPDQLRTLAGRLLEVICPDEADAREAGALERQEARAYRKTAFWMNRAGDGTTRGGFVLPDHHADMLRTALEAISAPRRRRAEVPADADGDAVVEPPDEHDRLPYQQRMGLALAELVEHLPVDRLPQSGGVAATVTIDLDHDTLRSGLGAATLSTGTRISAGEARRLACNAALIPTMLDGPSRILDLGTSQRLFDRYQRIALAKRDRGCVFPGCDRPPGWTEAHHNTPWAQGGPTDLANGSLLCGHHHRLVHRDHWQVGLDHAGMPELVDREGRVHQHRRFRPSRE